MFAKYTPIVKNTWSEYTVYRLNFLLWRVRSVLRLLTVYFLWQAIFNAQTEVFGYDRRQILTYILLSQVLSATVFSTRVHEAGAEINDGRLTNHLLKPLNYFRYLWARDLSDKLLNIVFSVAEIAILFWLLTPPLVLQQNIPTLLVFLTAVIFSAVLYFYMSLLLALLGFWTADIWAPRFLFLVATEFLAGGWFPLDILPRKVFAVLKLLPFTYLWFFPLKIYLGNLGSLEILGGLFITLIWLAIIYFLVQFEWMKGLRRYEAQGR